MASVFPFLSLLSPEYQGAREPGSQATSNSALLTWDRTIDKHCEELANPNAWNFALSVFILVGILISYLPQHARIVIRRSSEGLSPWFVLLGTTSGTSAFANILLLRRSQADVLCCRVNGTFSCAAGLLGIAQVGVQWSCFFAIMLLFLIFFPREPSDIPTTGTTADPIEGDHSHSNDDSHTAKLTHSAAPPPSYRTALLVVSFSLLHALLTFALSLLWFAYSPHTLQIWANFLGLLAATLACVQYIPQIYTTWKLQHVLSLSIPMMLIQTPGSFVFSFSLALRLGAQGWSAWGLYLVTGVLQGVLLGMAIAFELRDRKGWRVGGKRKVGALADEVDEGRGQSAAEADGNGTVESHERTPLLGGASEEGRGGATGAEGAGGINGSSVARYAGNGHETVRKSKLSIVYNADDGSPK